MCLAVPIVGSFRALFASTTRLTVFAMASSSGFGWKDCDTSTLGIVWSLAGSIDGEIFSKVRAVRADHDAPILNWSAVWTH